MHGPSPSRSPHVVPVNSGKCKKYKKNENSKLYDFQPGDLVTVRYLRVVFFCGWQRARGFGKYYHKTNFLTYCLLITWWVPGSFSVGKWFGKWSFLQVSKHWKSTCYHTVQDGLEAEPEHWENQTEHYVSLLNEPQNPAESPQTHIGKLKKWSSYEKSCCAKQTQDLESEFSQ